MEIDPRGPRFSAVITTVILAVVLVTGSVWLLAAQAVVFAAGSVLGLRYSPYGLLYRWLVRPRHSGSAWAVRCTCSSGGSGRAAGRSPWPMLTRRFSV